MSRRPASAPPWSAPPLLPVGFLLGLGFLSWAPAPGAAAAEESPKVHLGLGLEYEHFSYTNSGGGTLVDSRDAFTATPLLDWTPRDGVLLRYSGVLRKDYSEEERTRAFVYEDYLSLDRERWALRIGRQLVTWGRADSLRPTDVFQRHDFTDLIENREEGIEVVKLDFTRGARTLELVWAPVFDPDVVSDRTDNRWTGIPTEADVAGLGRVRLSFEEDARQRPPATLASGQFGARLSGSARGWDFAGMIYDGYDRIPTVIRRDVTALDPAGLTATLRLTPSHARIQVLGGDVATVCGAWGVRGEAAYTRTTDLAPGVTGVNDPYLRVTAGIDRTFSHPGLGESLTLIAQYALDTEPGKAGPIGSQDVDPWLHPYRQAFVLHTIWQLSEGFQVQLRGYLNLVQKDFVLQPEISWKPRDATTILLGGASLGGRTDTFFGQYRDNDRVRLLIAYAF